MVKTKISLKRKPVKAGISAKKAALALSNEEAAKQMFAGPGASEPLFSSPDRESNKANFDLSKIGGAFKGTSFMDVQLDYAGINDAWPSVDPGIHPFGSRVLVQLRKPKSKTAGGIYLPDDAKDTVASNTQIARVVSMGPVAFRDRKTLTEWPEGEWIKQGDFVRTPKFGGDRWQVEDSEGNQIQFAIFNDLELIGKVTGDPLKIKSYV